MKKEYYAHVIFTDSQTSIKWDTSVKVPQNEDDKDDEFILPQNNCDSYFSLVTNAVENIWGTNSTWQKTGRYDSGRVIVKDRHTNKEIRTGILKVTMQLI